MAYVLIEGYMCERCSYRWSARTGTGFRPEADPKVCPQCKSHYWNKPRKLDIPEEKKAAPWVKKRESRGCRNQSARGTKWQAPLPVKHLRKRGRCVGEEAEEQANDQHVGQPVPAGR